MTEDDLQVEITEPVEIDHGRFDRKWMFVGMALCALAAAFAIGLGSARLAEIFERSDTTEQAAKENCMRSNDLRRVLNVQAKWFIYHNTGTLNYFQTILPIVRGQPRALTNAIHRVIGVYKKVQHRYFTLPLIDCSDPDRPAGRSQPVLRGRGP